MRDTAGFPRFELARHVLPSRRAQFGDDAGMLRGEPILKLVERFDGRENDGGDFNGFRFHGGNLSWLVGQDTGFSVSWLFPVKLFRWCRGRRCRCRHRVQVSPIRALCQTVPLLLSNFDVALTRIFHS